MSEYWERQRGETSKAFAAFKFYRDTPPVDRSIAKCVRAYFTGDKEGEPPRYTSKVRQWQSWSAKYSWVSRTAAWEDEQDRVARIQKIQDLQDMARRHARIAMTMQSKAVARLQSLEPDELTPAEIRRYFVEAAQLERLSRGEPGSIVEQHVQEAELSTEEKRRRIQAIASELGVGEVDGGDHEGA